MKWRLQELLGLDRDYQDIYVYMCTHIVQLQRATSKAFPSSLKGQDACYRLIDVYGGYASNGRQGHVASDVRTPANRK